MNAAELDSLDQFRALVARTMGLRCDEGQLDRVAEVFQQRVGVKPFASYAGGFGREEVRTLAGLLTIGETSFYRTVDNFRALFDVVIPQRMRARAEAGDLRLRFLSAGCSSGEEAYTLAILLRENLPELASWDVRIAGIDINPQAVALARRAHYSAWSLRDTPKDIQEKYFRPAGRDRAIEKAMLPPVEFDQRNLVEEDGAFWQADGFDAIFCRNVTMYFTPDAQKEVIARLHRALVPGGCLFLGYAENLRGVSREFHLRHSSESFFYQKRRPDELRAPSAQTAPWHEEVRRSAERIESLVAPPPPRAPAALDLGMVLDLLRRERYEEATELLRTLPVEARHDPDAELLLAALLTNAGKAKEAEEVCRRILDDDDNSGGAHYLMALAREQAGDLDAAAEHDESAIYLDPSFAMPHLHLGLLAKRRGDKAATRRHLQAALELLGREDSSRILLFGGGFTRSALLEFCKSQLARHT